MRTILPGEALIAKKTDDVYCILGSCVGIVVSYKNRIGITHGRNPKETASLIANMMQSFPEYDSLVLLGGMKGTVGDNNIAGAKDALHSYKYGDRSGQRCVIVIRDNNMKIKLY